MDQPVTNSYELLTETEFTGALVLIVISSAYYIFYVIIVSLISNRSKQYKFVQSKEITVMWQSTLGFSLAIALVIHSLILNERDLTHMFILIVKSLISLAIATAFGYSIRAYLNVYYPFLLEKKLADIRFRMRKNPSTGNPVQLLNEEEEDRYLTEEMIRQEEEFHYDFDVWLDQISGETVIETYKGSTNKICETCNFRTLKLIKEERDEDTGGNVMHFLCSHCGHKEREHEV